MCTLNIQRTQCCIESKMQLKAHILISYSNYNLREPKSTYKYCKHTASSNNEDGVAL